MQVQSFRASNYAEARTELVCASFALEGSEKQVHLLPAGPRVLARDGRSFVVSNMQAVISASEMPLLVDLDHESEMPFGSTRASGWISKLSIKPDGIWGAVEWTADGARLVAARTYRYLSPVLAIDIESKEVRQIMGVALTNTPALRLSEIQAFSSLNGKSTGEARVYLARQRAERLNTMACSAEVVERLSQAGISGPDQARSRTYLATQRAARTGSRASDAAVAEELCSRGVTEEEQAKARAYLSARRGRQPDMET